MIRKVLLGLLLALSANAGVLTNKAELEEFKAKAVNGTAPYTSLRTSIINGANVTWEWGSISGSSTGDGGVCNTGGNTTYLTDAGSVVMAMAASAVLTSNASQANNFRTSARNHILDLTDTTFTTTPAGSYQCTLDLSLSIPVWIEAALLLEEQGAFSGADRTAFSNWLISVYRHPAWASRVRRNNWGAAGSLSSWLISNYVPPGTVLVEVAPGPATISTIDAKTEHNAMQLDRIRTVWQGDEDECLIWGIQADGGIPSELRRGTTGCTGTHILADDGSLTYQSMHTELLTYHAMAIWRLGNTSLTNLFTTDTSAIKRAYDFVIDNPAGNDFPWDSNAGGGLVWAAKYYNDAELMAASAALSCTRCGHVMPYMKVFSLLANNGTNQCP